MDVVPLSREPNKDAIQMLEAAIDMVKSGEITSVAVSWVTSDNCISGDVSSGTNKAMLWASIEHTARSFYNNVVCGEDE
jgi:GTPase